MLAAQSRAGSFLEQPACALADTAVEVPVADLPGTLVGPYRLVEPLGEGGMGTVFLAEQTRPVQRKVALKVVKDHGRVDVLVNNAGVAKSDVRAEDTSDEHWRFHMDVNVDGLFWCCRAFGRQMLAQGKGSIVNIGSMSGFIVNKPQPQSFYNASKAAVHHLTRSLAAEWGQRGVRVNAVAPTYIETPLTLFGMENAEMAQVWLEMTPMRRVGQPDEIGSVVLFLASDAASYVSGATIEVNGGR